jgi:hypothetical protein
MQAGGRDDGIGEKAIAWGSDLIKMTTAERVAAQRLVWHEAAVSCHGDSATSYEQEI